MKINRTVLNFLIGLCFLIVAPSYAQDWTMQNIAGDGSLEFAPGLDPLSTGFNSPGAMAVDSSGNIYFTVLGDYRIYRIKDGVLEIFHDEMLESGVANFLNGLAIDSQNNVYYSFSQTNESTGFYDRRYYIWKKTQDGVQTHIAGYNGENGFPPNADEITDNLAGSNPIGNVAGLKVRTVPDGSGGFTDFLYYSGYGEGQSFIQKIVLTDDSHPSYRVAGTNSFAPAEITEGVQATDFPVNVGLGFAWDSAGNLYYGTKNNRINRINASDQTIHFFAGNGTEGFSGDGGDATLASLNLSASGFLITEFNGEEVMLLCDSDNKRIRKIILSEDGGPNIISTLCGTGYSEGELGHEAGDLDNGQFKLASETNIVPFDILMIDNKIVFSDQEKRLRQAFLCDNPVINSISISQEVICKGDEVTLTPDGSKGDATLWNWFMSSDCGLTTEAITHDPTLTVIVTDNITYSVNLTGGCTTRDVCTPIELELNCKEFYNTFTPNGDGKNDFLEINTVQNYPTNTVSIYNRWGKLIKEIQNYDNVTQVWNGSDEANAIVETGTYYFSFQAGGEVILTGWIQLVN